MYNSLKTMFSLPDPLLVRQPWRLTGHQQHIMPRVRRMLSGRRAAVPARTFLAGVDRAFLDGWLEKALLADATPLEGAGVHGPSDPPRLYRPS